MFLIVPIKCGMPNKMKNSRTLNVIVFFFSVIRRFRRCLSDLGSVWGLKAVRLGNIFSRGLGCHRAHSLGLPHHLTVKLKLIYEPTSKNKNPGDPRFEVRFLVSLESG